MRVDPDRECRAEVRWFVAGDLAADLRPEGPARRRVDSYCIAGLSPVSSIKRRGDRRSLESKVRVGRVELVRVGDSFGFAERWLKRRLAGEPPSMVHGPWLDVAKQIWYIGEGEVARLSVAGGRWWTVAVPAGVARSRQLSALLPWIDAVSTAGLPHSYASWLTELSHRSGSRDAVA